MITHDSHGKIVGPCVVTKHEPDFTLAIRNPLLGLARCEPCERTCRGAQCGRSGHRMHLMHFFDRPDGTRGVWAEEHCD